MYYRAAEPDQPHNTQFSLRVDYNLSETDRFFIRANGNEFLESSLVDWTYDSPDPQFRGLHDVARATHGRSRHLDEGARQYGDRYSGCGQPRQSARHAEALDQLPPHVGGAAVLPRRLLRGALRVADGGLLANIARGWTLGGAAEYQPGALLQWNQNIFFYGDLKNIGRTSPKSRFAPTARSIPRRPGSTSSGTRPISRPASRSGCSPFRVDGVRGFDLAYVHANIARTFNRGGRRTFQFRVDIQNLLNRQHYANPEMDPTSTNFGQVRAVNNSVMRFLTFNAKFGFYLSRPRLVDVPFFE